MLTFAVCDLTIILKLLFVKSKIERVPVEVPHATKEESSFNAKLVTTPSLLASRVYYEKSICHTRINWSSLPVIQKPALTRILLIAEF